MKFRYCLYAVAAAFLLSAPSANAQESWTRFYKTNQVTDIAVHGDDIWCATTAGLVRWDRRTGTYQEISPKDNQAYNIVKTITISPDGTLWGITRGDTYVRSDNVRYSLPRRLVQYDGASWREHETAWYNYGNTEKVLWDIIPEKSLASLAVDSDGTVWGGLCFDVDYFYQVHTVGMGLSRLSGNAWTNEAVGSWGGTVGWMEYIEAGGKYVATSIAASDGLVWISTDSGVFRYDGQTVQSVGGEIGNLYLGPDKTVWLFDSKSIKKRVGESWVPTPIPGELLPINVSLTALVCDASHVLWAGTTNGLLRYDGTAWKRYAPADGLAGDSVSSLEVDDHGTLWIGTQAGLSGFDGTAFKTYRIEERLMNDTIRALAFGPNGTVWAATPSGISRFSGKGWRSFTMADGLPDTTINAITVTPKGEVWIATPQGAAHFIGSGWKTCTTADGLPSNTVYSTASGKDGTVWFATQNGVSRYSGTVWRTYTSADGLPDAGYNDIVTTPDGAVWVTSGLKIYRYNGIQWVHRITSIENDWYESTHSSIADLAPDNNGSILVAYNRRQGEGHYPTYSFFIHRIDADSTQAVAHKEGLFASMASAPDSTVWFGSGRGYRGSDSAQISTPYLFRQQGSVSTIFTQSDGLSSEIVNAIAVAPDGAVWFGTSKGLSRYGKPMATGVKSELARPEEFVVVSNYPNPFNPSTTISFTLPRSARAELAVYSIAGQKVRTLLSGPMEAGTHSAVWDGKDEAGKTVSSGIYIAHLRAGKQGAGHKMLFVK